VTVIVLLVPLALATPHLTPSLYGDEPFHLLVMGSLATDHDLDISDDLDLEHKPGDATYAPGRPLFHSPVLGMLLLPGYLVWPRRGAGPAGSHGWSAGGPDRKAGARPRVD